MMNSRTRRNRTAAAALAAAVAVSGFTFFTSTTALGDELREPDRLAKDSAGKEAGEAPQHAGVAANMYFTDEHGNRRQPTAAEVRETAEAFQRDLARLAGKHKDKPNVHTQSDGTVSATVAVSKLVFLTVEESGDGGLTYGHSSVTDDGKVLPQPANNPPEK